MYPFRIFVWKLFKIIWYGKLFGWNYKKKKKLYKISRLKLKMKDMYNTYIRMKDIQTQNVVIETVIKYKANLKQKSIEE